MMERMVMKGLKLLLDLLILSECVHSSREQCIQLDYTTRRGKMYDTLVHLLFMDFSTNEIVPISSY